MQQKVKLQPYLVLRTKKEHDQYIANVVSNYIAEYMKPHRKDAYNKGIDAGTTYGIDMAILALGRMNIAEEIGTTNESLLLEFMKNIQQAASDYGELFDIDLEENHDKDYWWSGSKLDKELHDYISPDVYPSFEERYKRGGVKSTTS